MQDNCCLAIVKYLDVLYRMVCIFMRGLHAVNNRAVARWHSRCHEAKGEGDCLGIEEKSYDTYFLMHVKWLTGLQAG